MIACLKQGEKLSIWLKNVWNKLYLWTADEDMKVSVIREVEFQRINNINNWKRTWKNLEGQGSIPSQVWIHIFSGSFLNWLGLSFIQLYNSYYSFWIIVAWISLEEIRTTLMWKLYVYFTFYFTLVDWLDKRNQLTFNCRRISFSSFQCQKYFIFDSYQQVVLRWRFTPMI